MHRGRRHLLQPRQVDCVGEPQACRINTYYRHLVFGAINGSVIGGPQVMLCSAMLRLV